MGEGNLALSFGVTMLGSLEKPDEVEGMLGKMIMDAMEEYIAEHAENSKIDKRVEDKVNKVADKARELAEELHRKVTTEELMEETGIQSFITAGGKCRRCALQCCGWNSPKVCGGSCS